ncbi:Biopolymer transport protein ExbD/TolR [Cystobacter fuscus DSM 2262]|uniref:Biopolymer transport protein ExbD/TolR n=1 Tax=Cystobacter fuscus (strain ATCC 25194 / DSM 2262 / NBRC 100088 / M29) TaxID=1242864 RepID=S9PEV9_CYSF2|nr:biopolymer transporter ExbD [Cystobacter fuscus]EPX61561.1 Biopolymer transport protein ExbD/TolR [Cystobacter fuscus DSM 2262]
MSARRQFVKPSTPPNSEINVTPLVDVVLVLLIIFMVLTPLLEKDIEVRIPETEEVPPPPDDTPDTQLIVKLDPAGAYTINTEPVTEADYVTKLKRMLGAKKKEDRIVFFVADDKANYGKLVAAFDGAKQAGAFVLGMATEDIPAAAAATGAPGEVPPVPPAPPAPPTP